jgi:hypothetical protein
MKVIIDRFEGEYAIVETESKAFVPMPRALIPQDAVEGSVISITQDKGAFEERHRRITELMNQVWKD